MEITELRKIQTDLVYAVDTGEKPINETMGPGDMSRKRTGAREKHKMTIRDGRPFIGSFDLEEHGFEFVESRRPHHDQLVYQRTPVEGTDHTRQHRFSVNRNQRFFQVARRCVERATWLRGFNQ